MFLPTSARTGFGIPGLRQALARRIDWAGLAQTRRPALFQRVRDAVERLRSQGEVTLPLADLRAQVRRADPDDYSERAVDQVVDQLARQGAIADTRLASGERVLVLQIGEIERYAGSLLFAAKANQRTRGVPILDEAEITEPDVEFPRIPRPERLVPSRERVVLEYVMELLIERGICLRQPGLLVFPSLFPEGGEEPVAGVDSVSLYYGLHRAHRQSVRGPGGPGGFGGALRAGAGILRVGRAGATGARPVRAAAQGPAQRTRSPGHLLFRADRA